MMNAERLRRAGIDYEAGVKRFQGDAELYETVLTAFLKETILEDAQSAFERGDRNALLRCVHELKGSCGNADMTDLYAVSCELVSLLRDDAGTDKDLEGLFTKLKNTYITAREGIRAAKEK